MRIVAATFAFAALLAGCSGSPAPDDGAAGLGGDGEPLAAPGAFDYTTPHMGGEPFTRTYQGSLTPDEAAQSNSVPFGASAPSFESCCSMDFITVTDLLQTDQLVALRLTLTWTNTEADRAGFDMATCLPWACLAFNFGEDESQSMGEHTDVLTLITSGRQDFEEAGMPYQVGVRYTNAVMSTAVPYTVAVEAHPVGNGLAPVDPYLLEVAEGANVTAELVGPFATEGVSVALMLYGEDDRPLDWIEVSGAHGSRHALGLAPGSYVVIPFDVQGGFLRLATDLEPAELRMERLQEEFGMVQVAQVPDVQEHAGTYTYQAEPGTIDPFPVFLYGDGAGAQDLFGVAPEDFGGAQLTLSSSSGTIAVVDQRQLYAQHPLGTNCLQCNFGAQYEPEFYVDDDGNYDLEWSSKGGSGTVVLFTAKYLR
ncbi:MAG TPA: hypothetical protein VJ874_01990 [Candidatus Thermoplasmatota archaeon]|nr:hypothetical protein [Candidatus Thermoplasmatota archaeon]